MMGLFDKKYCDICGEKIGLLGNRKLADGNMCKNCAKKLSPWFSERKKSTIADIKDQLEWREENKKLVAGFHPTKRIGQSRSYKLLIDENAGEFTVTDANDLTAANPDILDLSAVTGCSLDTDESKYEIYRKDKDGKNVSYNPRRYVYNYDFYCTIYVETPFFNEMRFRLNPMTVKIEERPGGYGRGGFGSNFFQPDGDAQYRNYMHLGEEMKDALLSERDASSRRGASDTQNSFDGSQQGSGTYFGAGSIPGQDYGVGSVPGQNYGASQDTTVQTNAVQGSGTASAIWICPACGASNNGGKFCEFCGTPRA